MEHDLLEMPQEQTGEGRKLACVPRDPGLVSHRLRSFREWAGAAEGELSGFANAVAGFAQRRPSLALKWVFGGGPADCRNGIGPFAPAGFAGTKALLVGAARRAA